MGALGSTRNRKTVEKKSFQTAKNSIKPRKTLKPDKFSHPSDQTLIDPTQWWQAEHAEVSRLFEISGGA